MFHQHFLAPFHHVSPCFTGATESTPRLGCATVAAVPFAKFHWKALQDVQDWTVLLDLEMGDPVGSSDA